MPNSKLTELTTISSLSAADLFYVVHDPAGSPSSRAVSLSDLTSSLAPFSDATALVKNAAAATKQWRVDVSGVTAGQTRVMTVPDSNTVLPIAPQQITFAGMTGAGTVTFPANSFAAARIDAGQTFAGTNVFGALQSTSHAIGGATIGSNTLAVTGTAAVSGNTVLGAGSSLTITEAGGAATVIAPTAAGGFTFNRGNAGPNTWFYPGDGRLVMASGGFIGWTSISSNAATSPDSSLSRLGAASLAIGNGTAGDFSGSLKLASVVLSSITSAGNLPITIGATNTVSLTDSTNGTFRISIPASSSYRIAIGDGDLRFGKQQSNGGTFTEAFRVNVDTGTTIYTAASGNTAMRVSDAVNATLRVSFATGNVAAINTQGHNLVIGTQTTDGGAITEYWRFNSSGHLVTGTDNTYDIGQNGATRPRHGFFGGTVRIGSTGAFSFENRAKLTSSADGVLVVSNDAGTNTLTFTNTSGNWLVAPSGGTTSFTGSVAVSGNATISGGAINLGASTGGITAASTLSLNSTSGNVNLFAGTSGVVGLGASDGVSRWQIDMTSNGDLLPNGSNARTIGSASSVVKNIVSTILTVTGNTAPADGTLTAGQCARWFDATNGAAKTKFKAKTLDGTVVAGELAMA